MPDPELPTEWRTQSEAFARLDRNGNLQEVNPAFEHLYAVEAREVEGQPLEAVLLGMDGPLPWRTRISAGNWRAIEQHVAPGGLQLWTEASMQRCGDGTLFRARRAAALDEARRTHDLTELLTDALAAGGIGFWYDDGTTNELHWSEQARRVYKHTDDGPITHEVLFSTLHPDDRERFGAEIQQAIAGRQKTARFRFRIGSGDDVHHVESLVRILYDGDGQLRLGLGAVRNLDETEQLKARVAELERQLDQAQRVDSIGRLASGVAHDFNNLLTGIVGIAELLAMGSLDAKQGELVGELLRCAERGSGLTRQLLSHARPQVLDVKALDPQEVVSAICRLMRTAIPATVGIVLDEFKDADWRMRADAGQVQQVVSNLILNASHAMPDGGQIKVGCRSVTLDKATEQLAAGDYVCIEVRDSGEGIPQEIQHRVFEPFFTTKQEGRGTGLGLSVALDVARRHNGDLRIESTEGEGTRVTLWLPRAEPDEVRADQSEPPLPSERFGGGKRVLLVEDESMVRVITRALLEQWGFEVVESDDGVKALELSRRLQEPVDLLLTDVIMPRMTGPDLVAELRKHWSELKVLYVSGYSPELVNRRFAPGTESPVLAKPYTSEELQHALAKQLATS